MDQNSLHAAVGRRRRIRPVASGLGVESGFGRPVAGFGTIDVRLTAERPAPEHWTEVTRTRSTRHIGVRSARSFRVSLVDEHGQEIRAESLLEAQLILVLLTLPGVLDVIEQPPPVVYLDHRGKRRRHWFDCVAILADGRRMAYVVKPKALAALKGTHLLVDRLARHVTPDVAATITLVDEDFLPPDQVYNAELIHSVRLHGPWRDDACVRDVEALVSQPMLLDDAVERAAHGGHGFRAIVRLIADGVLRVDPGEHIDYGTVVEPTRSSGYVH